MTYQLSSEARRAVCAVLGLPRKITPDGPGISDGALVLFLVLVLTAKPVATDAERRNGALYHDDPLARCHDELQRKVGPARTGAQGGRATIKASDKELADLRLIEREQVENEFGARKGRHTPYRRVPQPQNGRPVELGDDVLAFVAAVIRDPVLAANRKAQAVRFAAERGMRLAGENAAFELALGITWKAVKDFHADMEAAGYARVTHTPPPAGKRGRCVHEMVLSATPHRSRDGRPQSLPTSPKSGTTTTAEAIPRAAGLVKEPQAPEFEAGPAVQNTSAISDDTVLQFESLDELRSQLWFRHHVDECIDLARRQDPDLDDQDVIESIVKPVRDLQKKAGHDKNAVAWALVAVLTDRDGPLYGPNSARRFPGFVSAVFKAHRNKFGPPEKERHPAMIAVRAREAAEEARTAEKHRSSREHNAAAKATRFLTKAAEFDAEAHAKHAKHIAKHVKDIALTFDQLGLGGYYEVSARLTAAVERSVKTWAEAQLIKVDVRRPGEFSAQPEPTREEEAGLGRQGRGAAQTGVPCFSHVARR